MFDAWETKDILVVAAAALSAAVTILVPAINHFLTTKRYSREKVWDLKRDIYNKILAGLYDAKRQFGNSLSFTNGMNDDALDKWVQRGYDGYHLALDVQRGNQVVCSDSFSRRFIEFEVGFARAMANTDMVERLKGYATVCNSAHEDLLRLARKELRLH